MPRSRNFVEADILKKAADLFWKQGFHATSMDNLVKTLGINRASIYNSFGDKKALFDKAIHYYQIENRRNINNFLEHQNSVKEGIKNLFLFAIEDTFNDADRRGCMIVNCAAELLPEDKDFLKTVLENRLFFTNFFKDYLQKGIEEGTIPSHKDIDALASLLFTIYSGIKVVAKMDISKTEMTNAIMTGLSVLD